jgi:hypothetical protein
MGLWLSGIYGHLQFLCVLFDILFQVFNLLTSSDLFRLPPEDQISKNLMDRIHLWWMLRLLEIPAVPVPLIDGSPCASDLLVADSMNNYLYLLIAIYGVLHRKSAHGNCEWGVFFA